LLPFEPLQKATSSDEGLGQSLSGRIQGTQRYQEPKRHADDHKPKQHIVIAG